MYYVLENQRRAKQCDTETEEGTDGERLENFVNKSDKENLKFRYVL